MLDFSLRFILSRIVQTGSLEVVTGSNRRLQFGDGNGPHVRIRFTDKKSQLAFLLDPDLKLGELYTDERLIIEAGDIYDFVSLMLINQIEVKLPAFFRWMGEARFNLTRVLQRNRVWRARTNVAHHYDLDRRLYDLFLDEDRQYSCAYFETPEASLDEAQLAKKRHIAAKLRLRPGHRVLDIGCGWGGLALYLNQTGEACKITGITLSTEQLDLAQERARTAGVEADVAFRLIDYREVDERYDRLVSVGMFEHVGIDYYDVFFKKVATLLEEDGVMLLHTIGNAGVPTFTNAWVTKYIFPGGHIPSLSDITKSVERAGLFITDVEVLRMHYAYTVQHWRKRFAARRDEAKALYDERFCRMWECYLAMSEAAFRYDQILVFQVQLARQQEAVPLTRDYIMAAEAKRRAAEQRMEIIAKPVAAEPVAVK